MSCPYTLLVPTNVLVVEEVGKIGNLKDFDIYIGLEGHGVTPQMIMALREVVIQAMIVCDRNVNGSRN